MTVSTASMNSPADGVTYRGYPVEELSRRHSFEEVAYLLWHGELPTRDQVLAQNRAERAQRAVGPHVAAVLAAQPPAARPLDTLRVALAAIAAHDQEPGTSPAAIRAKALSLFAVLPSIVAADQRRRHGLGAVTPRSDLGYAENFLYMTFGKIPEPQVVAAFEKSLILYAEHSFDPATLSGRVNVAFPDLYGALAGGIGALNGPPYGIGCQAVLDTMNDIAIPDNARPWLEEALSDGRRIPGFRHREDARVSSLRTALGAIAALRGGRLLIDVHDALATAVGQGPGLHPSLDYPTAPAYHLIGFDPQAIDAVLAVARVPGWTAHIAGRLVPRQSAHPLPGRGVPAERQTAVKR
jgi:citrate synthase